MEKSKQNLRVQIAITLIAILLFAIKLLAWWLTGSIAILTDALESTANVAAGIIGVYSLYVAAKPKDHDHPYGHGKVEFISAAMEGTFIGIAGCMIIYEAVMNLFHPHAIQQLDTGMWLIGSTAILNFLAGTICLRIGKKNSSLALIASGRHLRSDMYTTAGILGGLVLLWVTKISWVDSAVAIIFACIILITAYRIIRASVAGIMDEADRELLDNLIVELEKKRKENWIDLHNLRIIKYGSTLHLDMHLTVPWFFNVHQAHDEIDLLSDLVVGRFGESVELFVHTDGCLPFSCAICNKQNCPERKSAFQRRIEWNFDNLVNDFKHSVNN